MTELARPVGLGLASHGPVEDAVRQAAAARDAGLHSVWFHESYFERDAVSYATAIAAQVPDVGIALGAVSPLTRHPVLLAMTVSALDDLAPGRITVALGSALPLRLAQMRVPYDPDEAIERIEAALGDLRRLWRGERIPGAPGVPELEPMFPPVHRVPLWVAGYRKAFHQLAGRAADGYLARPAESLTGIEVAASRIADAALEAGRDPTSVAIGGYLLCLVDSSRTAALDRAKREPFVLYMLSIQSPIAMRRAGLDPAILPPIAAAWRAEDYTRAAALVPDELVDAFLLCGTVDGVADRVEAFRTAGMTLPIVQPAVQDDDQVQAAIEVGRRYGEARSLAGVGAGVAAGAGAGAGAAGVAGAAARSAAAPVGLARRVRGLVEIVRPFSFTASIVPVVSAGALAAVRHELSWPLLVAALVAGVALQVGTNVVNEVYDVRTGVDDITSPRASHALVTGRVSERAAFVLAGSAFAVAAAVGLALVAVRGWPLLVVGAAGLVGGWGYTAPPLEYKYRALGLPLVFLLMGPLMVVGSYYCITGRWSGTAAVLSLPIGLLVTAILHGNEWRDIAEDARAGVSTLSIRTGRARAHAVYVGLVVGAFVCLAVSVAVGALPRLALLAMLSLPLLARNLRASELGSTGQQRAIAMIDLQTAQLHAAFGALLTVGLVVTVAWNPR